MHAANPQYEEHRRRLKDKYLEAGIGAFHDYETVELLLSYAIPRRDVKPLAKELFEQFGTLRGIVDADVADLEKISGIGRHTAILLKLIKDLGIIYLRENVEGKTQISCTTELLDFCKANLGGLKDESFCVIYLDAMNKIIEFETVQEGIVNQAVVYPRRVLENALRRKASAIILVHNHPSGNVRPSDADIRLTKTIQDAARVMDILVHDHLIIGENRSFSFREEGIMP
ncbi:MAG: DNA repair protein RadC [Deltaproteobacteria bacterium]|nr:DNA repair protein RadC [Deltaproteobacteria bacterium]